MAFGAENETRTRDPDLGKVVLYQLSYFRSDLMSFPSNGITKVRLFFELANFLALFFKNPLFVHRNDIFLIFVTSNVTPKTSES